MWLDTFLKFVVCKFFVSGFAKVQEFTKFSIWDNLTFIFGVLKVKTLQHFEEAQGGRLGQFDVILGIDGGRSVVEDLRAGLGGHLFEAARQHKD